MRECATGHARIEEAGATGHAQSVRVIHRRRRDRTCATKEPGGERDRICVKLANIPLRDRTCAHLFLTDTVDLPPPKLEKSRRTWFHSDHLPASACELGTVC